MSDTPKVEEDTTLYITDIFVGESTCGGKYNRWLISFHFDTEEIRTIYIAQGATANTCVLNVDQESGDPRTVEFLEGFCDSLALRIESLPIWCYSQCTVNSAIEMIINMTIKTYKFEELVSPYYEDALFSEVSVIAPKDDEPF